LNKISEGVLSFRNNDLPGSEGVQWVLVALDAREGEAAMNSVGVEATQCTVVLVGRRTLRKQCLGRFLELSGLGVRIVPLENIRESLLDPSGSIDLAIIDAGEHTCRNPDITTSFTCLREALPSVPIVVVSDREDWAAVSDALTLGAQAYFPSSLDPDILIETLRFVERGGAFIPPSALINAPVHRNGTPVAEGRRTELHRLTPSEQRVLELLKAGQPNKAIARELGIEETTVKVHVRRIMKKLNAANRTQVALVAQQMAEALA
jgi:DNA-binding NarL/FixJ family response regulator